MKSTTKGMLFGLLAGLVVGGLLMFFSTFNFGVSGFLLLFLPGLIGGLVLVLIDKKYTDTAKLGLILYVIPLIIIYSESLLEDFGMIKGCSGNGSCSDVRGMIIVVWLVGGALNILAAYLVGKLVVRFNSSRTKRDGIK